MKRGMWIACTVFAILIVALVAFQFGKQSATQTSQSSGEQQSQLPLSLESSSLQKNAPSSPGGNTSPSTKQELPAPFRENRGCQGSGAINFTSPPRRIEDIDNIQPLGLMIGGHVTPIDHQYWNQPNWKSPDQLTLADLRDVLAPADGVITTLQRMPLEYSSVKNGLGDYRMIIHHTCTFYTIYIHLYWLPPKLQEALDRQEKNSAGATIFVQSGELIGRASGFDFSTHNDEVVLKGFLVPEHYDGEGWKIHTVDPFDYFQEPLRSQFTAKVLRTASPIGGKIDYDIDGKLIGNWFKENTGGYTGKSTGEYGYWNTHLAFAPDGNDPSHFIASVGNFSNEAQQFGIKGNTDPSKIGIEQGLMKLELTPFDYMTADGRLWDHMHFARPIQIVNRDDQIQGTLLIQILEKRKLKAEVFPDKKASEIQGFTEKAMVYER